MRNTMNQRGEVSKRNGKEGMNEMNKENNMSETKPVLVPYRKLIRRDDFDVYFPIPVFVGDGKVWTISFQEEAEAGEDWAVMRSVPRWLWIRDLRHPLTYDGSTDLKIKLNRCNPSIPFATGDEMLVRGIKSVSIKTIKGGKFTLLSSDRPLTFHGHMHDELPLEESVSVNSEEAADSIVKFNENLRFHRQTVAEARIQCCGSWTVESIKELEALGLYEAPQSLR